MFFDNLDLLALCLGLLHTTGICKETFHGVVGGRLFNHLDLSPLLFCSFEARLVRCDTFDRVFGFLDRLVDGLVDVLIDSILRFALGAFGGSIHKTIEIALGLYLRNIEQRQRHDAPDEPCHDNGPPFEPSHLRIRIADQKNLAATVKDNCSPPGTADFGFAFASLGIALSYPLAVRVRSSYG